MNELHCKRLTTKCVIELLKQMNQLEVIVLVTWNGNRKINSVENHLKEMNCLLQEESILSAVPFLSLSCHMN